MCNSISHRSTSNNRNFIFIHYTSLYYISTIRADASPPPIQRLANPRFAALFFISYNKVTSILVPLAPIGCPKATAPPLTFTLSTSSPKILFTLAKRLQRLHLFQKDLYLMYSDLTFCRHFLYGICRCCSKPFRLFCSRRLGDNFGHRFDTQFLCLLFSHDNDSSRTIIDRRSIGSCYGPSFSNTGFNEEFFQNLTFPGSSSLSTD